MPIPVTMPRLSDTMEQGTVVKWHVKVGDTVSSGDVLADIETDKATMELQSFDDGTVAKLSAEEGQKIAVGQAILILAGEGESAQDAAGSGDDAAGGDDAEQAEESGQTPDDKDAGSDADGKAPPADTKQTAKAGESSSNGQPKNAKPSTASNQPAGPGKSGSSRAAREDDEEPAEMARPGDRVFASPLARKIAEEHDLDLASVSGSGPAGRIVRKDVESALASGVKSRRPDKTAQTASPMVPAPGASLEDRTVELNTMRAVIARRLVESKSSIPHYQVTVSARLDTLMDLREQLNTQLEPQGVKLSVNDFLVRACALAMHQHPFVNSSWVEKGPSVQLHGRVNIGVAVALPEERGGGLVVATIRDADQVGLRQISAETRRLAKKAREKGLTIEEMSDSTFTISNMGMMGVDHFTAIINPPNAAILAVGRAIERPFIEHDEDGEPTLVVGHEMAMTMSSDHRIIDGAMAAGYLATVRELLENPAVLLV